MKKQHTFKRYLNFAALFIGLIGIAGFFYTGSQKKDLEYQLSESSTQIENLQNDLDNIQESNDVLKQELAFVKEPTTVKYILRGNEKARSLVAMAYFNATESKGMVEIEDLPVLDQDHDYQLWADVKGEMISLALLDNKESKILDPSILKKASSLNITIEPAGGNDHATVENLVAAIAINTQP